MLVVGGVCFGVYLSFGCEKFMGRSFFFFDPILRNFAALFSLLQFSLLSLDAQHDFSDTPMPQSELLRTLSQFFPCQFPLVHFLVFGRSQSLSFSNLECFPFPFSFLFPPFFPYVPFYFSPFLSLLSILLFLPNVVHY